MIVQTLLLFALCQTALSIRCQDSHGDIVDKCHMCYIKRTEVQLSSPLTSFTHHCLTPSNFQSIVNTLDPLNRYCTLLTTAKLDDYKKLYEICQPQGLSNVLLENCLCLTNDCNLNMEACKSKCEKKYSLFQTKLFDVKYFIMQKVQKV
jgi:hypothetical protein